MPKSSKAKLAYQKAYNARPEMVNRREANNAARRAAIRAGTAKVGDGKDIAHEVPLDRGGNNSPSNLHPEDRSKNRGWRKGRKGYSVPTEG